MTGPCKSERRHSYDLNAPCYFLFLCVQGEFIKEPTVIGKVPVALVLPLGLLSTFRTAVELSELGSLREERHFPAVSSGFSFPTTVAPLGGTLWPLPPHLRMTCLTGESGKRSCVSGVQPLPLRVSLAICPGTDGDSLVCSPALPEIGWLSLSDLEVQCY